MFTEIGLDIYISKIHPERRTIFHRGKVEDGRCNVDMTQT
jgi:hypothetical protein